MEQTEEDMLQLIVHADDFGISRNINEGILEAYSRGILTSASIMPNGEAFDHAVNKCVDFPGLDVGIHLSLVGEVPFSKPCEIPSLVTKEGKFHPHFKEFLKRYCMGSIDLVELERELDKQIARVVNSGITVSHIDSHQHLHMLPEIWKITVELARKYNIPAIRFPKEKVSLAIRMLMDGGRIIRFFEMLALNWFCKTGREMNLLRTDHFAGFLFGGKLNKRNLLKVLGNLPSSGTCELMCHPGIGDPGSRYEFWGYSWPEELNALIDPEIIEFIRQKGIRLISYRHLAEFHAGR